MKILARMGVALLAGVLTHVAGNGSTCEGAIIPEVVVADFGAKALIGVNPFDGTQRVISQGDLFALPFGIAVSETGQFFVADRFAQHGSVIGVNPANGVQRMVSPGTALPDGTVDQLFDLLLDDQGDILAVFRNEEGNTGGILRINPITGDRTTISSGGSFVNPFGIALESSGQILIADSNAFANQGAIFRVDPVTGTQTPLSIGGELENPFDLKVGPQGQIFVADRNSQGIPIPNDEDAIGGAVLTIDPLTGAQTIVSSGGLFVDPFGLTFTPDGQLLVADASAFGGDADDPDVSGGGLIFVDPISGNQSLLSSGGLFGSPSRLAIHFVPEPNGWTICLVTMLSIQVVRCSSIFRTGNATGRSGFVAKTD